MKTWLRKIILVIILVLVALVILGVNEKLSKAEKEIGERGEKVVKRVKNSGYLAQYNFENLKNREYKASEIEKIGQKLVVDDARKALVERGDLAGKNFDFETWAISFESEGKKISGMMNLPLGYKNKKSPAIIMVRGYAETQGYYIGSGSWRAADELARNGYITLSLDFLGFGLSDMESTDILEARFVKPLNVIDLIESVKEMEEVDPEKIGIWAHSNGGQIAISVLEIMGADYPTVLWAPMTNPFPQSVLETVDDGSEAGLIVKNKIEEFEKEYDSKLYSINTFYSWINSPILIHQGTEDAWCKVEWQKSLQNELSLLGKEVRLDIVVGNDHNFKQSWDEVMKKDVNFFNEKFTQR